MMRARPYLLVPLLAAGMLVSTAACRPVEAPDRCRTTDTENPRCPPKSPPPSPEPTGTLWPDGWTFQATAITENGARKRLVSGTQLTIVVEYPYHLQVSAGCDHMFVDGSSWNGVFTLTKVDANPHPCPDDLVAQDTWLRQFFADSPQWTHKDDRLTLRTDHVQIDLVAVDITAR